MHTGHFFINDMQDFWASYIKEVDREMISKLNYSDKMNFRDKFSLLNEIDYIQTINRILENESEVRIG